MDNSIFESLKIKKRPLCIICEEKEAEYCIKGIPKDCYCYDCAIESFDSIDVLEKLE